MKKEKEYAIEDLIRSTDELLDGISIEELEIEGPSEAKRKIENEVQRREYEELGLDKKSPIDGVVEIRVSQDDMLVTADFYPPSGAGSGINEADVRDKLESYGIVFGIEWETIRENVCQCNDRQ